MPTRRTLLAATAAAGLLPIRARAAEPVRIGVLGDQSGPYSDSSGPGAVLAARMAAKDFGPTVLGQPIEVISGDTQNKPDVAGTLARQWFDGGVDAILDLPVTPVAAAVQQVAREKNRTVMINGAAVTDFTSRLCSPISSHWADDTQALTAGTTQEVMRTGGKTWFFITVDFTFGTSIETLATSIIQANGGKVLGAARYPIGTTDFSGQILQAQASGAQVIGLASVGTEQVNLIKQAAEFGLTAKQTLTAFLVYLTDIHALGLRAAQNLVITSGFYWDQNEVSRTWSQRFFAERRAMPTREQASIYACTTHYLRAMAQAGTRDALAVNKAMRAMKAPYFGQEATLRGDGRAIYDLALWRVKTPEQSTSPWDLYAPLARIPAAEAFAPAAASCL